MTDISPLSQAQLRSLGIKSAKHASKKVAAAAARQDTAGQPLSGKVKSPAFQVSETFGYQSFFDDALLERALVRQNPNEPIVKSTLSKPIQTAGYGLALHPSSETPVAVQFETGAQQGASQTYQLKPGETIRPQGMANGEPGFFTGFQWGIPFGWLGGGMATLIVLRSPDAQVEWATDHNEVIYHRMRIQIVDPVELPVDGVTGEYNGPLNWPQRFPWPFARFGTDALPQGGKSILSVAPTRTALSLRLDTVTLAAAPADGVFRMYWVGTDAWGQDPLASTVSLSDIRATDQVWGTWAQQAGAPAPFSNAFQTMILTGEAERYAANAGALAIASLDPQLQDAYVDIVRWGRL